MRLIKVSEQIYFKYLKMHPSEFFCDGDHHFVFALPLPLNMLYPKINTEIIRFHVRTHNII